MYPSGTLSCFIADVVPLTWDGGELPGKSCPYEAMFSGEAETWHRFYTFFMIWLTVQYVVM